MSEKHHFYTIRILNPLYLTIVAELVSTQDVSLGEPALVRRQFYKRITIFAEITTNKCLTNSMQTDSILTIHPKYVSVLLYTTRNLL